MELNCVELDGALVVLRARIAKALCYPRALSTRGMLAGFEILLPNKLLMKSKADFSCSMRISYSSGT